MEPIPASAGVVCLALIAVLGILVLLGLISLVVTDGIAGIGKFVLWVIKPIEWLFLGLGYVLVGLYKLIRFILNLFW